MARVDPQTGEVLRTVLTWEHVRGSITVDYGRAPGIPVPVPTSMSERFITRDGEGRHRRGDMRQLPAIRDERTDRSLKHGAAARGSDRYTLTSAATAILLA